MMHAEAASLERVLRNSRFVISQRVGVALSGNEAHGPIPIATLERIAQSDAALPTALRWRAYALAAVSGDASIRAEAALDLLTSACVPYTATVSTVYKREHCRVHIFLQHSS